MANIAASHCLQIQTPYTSFSAHLLHGPKPSSKRLAFSPLQPPKPLPFLFRHLPKPSLPVHRVSSSISTPPLPSSLPPTAPTAAPLSDSMRTVSSIFATVLSVSQLLLKAIQSIYLKIATTPICPTLEEMAVIDTLQSTILCSASPLFFARSARFSGRTTPSPRISPMNVIAEGMVRWLDLYSGVLLIRILLSWFPSIPWDRQPLSAIRDLCDPYLNLFRNIVPPLFNLLDVSPIFAFMVLGILSSILKGGG
ncbi:hypothetical protein Dimus_002174 [Dionaea muscipula]